MVSKLDPVRSEPSANPYSFFALVYVFAVPLIALGFIVKTPDGTPLHLPASAIMFVVPGLVATMLAATKTGRKGVKTLWGQLRDKTLLARLPWYAAALVIMPAFALVTLALLPLFGATVPQITVTAAGLAALFAVYYITAVFEEIGWTGYAFNSLQRQWGLVGGSLVLGTVWAGMHAVPWVQVHGLVWAIGWAVFSIAIRVPMAWLYVRSGHSLQSVVLFHACINVVASIIPGFTDDNYMAFAFAGCAVVLACLVRFRSA